MQEDTEVTEARGLKGELRDEHAIAVKRRCKALCRCNHPSNISRHGQGLGWGAVAMSPVR
eukprot:scaffold216475_cov10-Tisochrysis_lutea.AAC.1